MSYISDPDRLERLAMYVIDEPPNTSPRELADALNDAAVRIRRLQQAMQWLHAVEPTITTHLHELQMDTDEDNALLDQIRWQWSQLTERIGEG